MSKFFTCKGGLVQSPDGMLPHSLTVGVRNSLMQQPDLLTRPMTLADIDAVVRIHQGAFQGFFLTRMGPRFLRSYYRTVLDYAGSVALVVADSGLGEPLGFAVGFHEPHRFYALFRQRRLRLLPAMLRAVIMDPSLVFAILQNMRRIEAERDRPQLKIVELSSIGVGKQGAGIGSQLIEAFVAQAVRLGSKQIKLTTDRDNNDGVRAFYERRGFVLDGLEDRGKRSLCRYIRTIG